jgi:hypothetical protein
MALKPKTFRTSDDVIEALKAKVEESGNLSESEIINKALRCFLGLNTEIDCFTYSNEIQKINERISKLVQLNNLREV